MPTEAMARMYRTPTGRSVSWSGVRTSVNGTVTTGPKGITGTDMNAATAGGRGGIRASGDGTVTTGPKGIPATDMNPATAARIGASTKTNRSTARGTMS